MRILISAITLIFVQSAFAGGGSVGTMKVKDLIAKLNQTNSIQIVYQLQKDSQTTLFTLGLKKNEEWKFQNIRLANEESSTHIIFDSLQESADKRDWIKLK